MWLPDYMVLKSNFDELNTMVKRWFLGAGVAIMEGGARSRKTYYSFIDFLVYVCLYCVDNKTIISVKKEIPITHSILHFYRFGELSLDEFGLHNPFKTSYTGLPVEARNNPYSSRVQIMFVIAHGAPSHICCILMKCLTIPRKIFDTYVMRCSHVGWRFFNPSVTEHCRV
jgi:hypothetical protein